VASISYPNPAYNGGAVEVGEHEQLAHSGFGTGIVGNPATTSQVAYTDGTGTRAVYLRAERWVVVRGLMWYSGPTLITINLDANVTSDARIDRVVLRVDRGAETVTEEKLTGVAGSGVPPALAANTGVGSGTWEFPLGRATVGPGATTLAPGDFVPEAWYLGGQSIVTNGADTAPGAAQQQAAALRYDAATDEAFVSTGAAWRQVYSRSGKVALTAAAGWSLSGYGGWVRRNNNMVTLAGQFYRTGAQLSTGASLLTRLPEGFWPAESIPIHCYLQGSSAGLATLAANGNLHLNSYANATATGEYVVVPTQTFAMS
jgi:hypothetical protein